MDKTERHFGEQNEPGLEQQIHGRAPKGLAN
jgi:hypothetical protein